MKHKVAKVLVILPLAFQEGLDKYAGIIRFLRDIDRTWNIHLDRMTRSTDNRPNYRLDDFDGIIADDPTSEQDGKSLLRSTLPLVALDWRNRTALSHRRKTVSIYSDPKAIGRKAAEAFLDIGQYASYAYLSPGLPSSWSAERLDAFLKRLVRKGLDATVLNPGPTLAKQLLQLQKPAAVFAANDIAAADFLDLAKDLQVSVPLDVSVIGVDNEQITCTNTTPPLASIQPDFEKAGHLAASSLQALLDGKSPAKSRHYPIKGVVRRKSLGIPRGNGRLAERACQLIDNTPLPDLSRISNIANQLGISRRTLDKCFQQIVGCSVLDFIQRRRLLEMQRLLKSSHLSITQICAACFPSCDSYPMRFFKRKVGMTMLQYRNFKRPALHGGVRGSRRGHKGQLIDKVSLI